VRDFKSVDHFIAPGDRSCDTAHAQWPFQVILNWWDWVTHNWGTDNRRFPRIGKCVGRIKPRSKCQTNIVHKTSTIWWKRRRI